MFGFQAEIKEKERLKEESKKLKKLESAFKNLLRELNIDFEKSWEEIRSKVENEEEFKAFGSETERERVYKVSSSVCHTVLLHMNGYYFMISEMHLCLRVATCAILTFNVGHCQFVLINLNCLHVINQIVSRKRLKIGEWNNSITSKL